MQSKLQGRVIVSPVVRKSRKRRCCLVLLLRNFLNEIFLSQLTCSYLRPCNCHEEEVVISQQIKALTFWSYKPYFVTIFQSGESDWLKGMWCVGERPREGGRAGETELQCQTIVMLQVGSKKLGSLLNI